MTVDSSGNVFVYDDSYKRILKYSSQGKFLKKINEPITGFGFGGMITDADGDLYFLEENKVYVFDRNGKHLREFGPVGNDPEKSLSGAHGMALDDQGLLYVVDGYVEGDASGSYEVKIYDRKGKRLGVLIDEPIGLFHANSIAVDHQGHVWLLDSAGPRLLEYGAFQEKKSSNN
jgi:DNA-binding beta-propeller fold protein YncE